MRTYLKTRVLFFKNTVNAVEDGFQVVALSGVFGVEEFNELEAEGLVGKLLGHFGVYFRRHDEPQEKLVHHLAKKEGQVEKKKPRCKSIPQYLTSRKLLREGANTTKLDRVPSAMQVRACQDFQKASNTLTRHTPASGASCSRGSARLPPGRSPRCWGAKRGKCWP